MPDETASDRLQAHYGNEYPITLCGLGVVAGASPEPSEGAIERARLIAADVTGATGLIREAYLAGTFDHGEHVRIALAALSPPIQDERLPTRLFDALKHGDETHRAWLKDALAAFFAGQPIPESRAASPIPSGDERLRKALETARSDLLEQMVAAGGHSLSKNAYERSQAISRIDAALAPASTPNQPEETPAEEIDRLARHMVAIAPQAGRYVGVLIYDTREGLKRRLRRVVSSLPATPTKGTE